MALNPVHKIIKTSISLSNAINFTLSISIKINGFCFIISDNKNTINAADFVWRAKDWSVANANIKEILLKQELLKYKYKKVSVFIESEQTTLIPTEFYSISNQQSALDIYLGNTHFIANAQKLTNENAYLVFGIEKDILNTLKKSFIRAKYYHHSAFSIDTALKNKGNTQTITLRIAQNSFEVIASNKGSLIAHNNFSYQTIDEFLFLLISFVKQQGFDIAKVNLIISGQLLMTSEIGKQLNLYFSNIIGTKNLELKNEEIPFSIIINHSIIANS